VHGASNWRLGKGGEIFFVGKIVVDEEEILF
jgi:hypothetical protein